MISKLNYATTNFQTLHKFFKLALLNFDGYYINENNFDFSKGVFTQAL